MENGATGFGERGRTRAGGSEGKGTPSSLVRLSGKTPVGLSGQTPVGLSGPSLCGESGVCFYRDAARHRMIT